MEGRQHYAPRNLSTSEAPGAQDCPYYKAEELSAYASGLLTPQEAEPVERHLHACDVCLSEVTAIHRTLHLLKRDAMLAPPARLVAAVQQAFTAVPSRICYSYPQRIDYCTTFGGAL